ncbi:PLASMODESMATA CALLOSE-BINDING PROTEIN 4-like [Cannabis sativa]|uniref:PLASMODESMATA CALLOSE-BINDING PROTEIN 4-like n=1 Tax=Cannabis sativa TaxID=3483 RepID=UPI0029CA52BA|nr:PLASMODESMATA CALLOSE-BINDING PROTEIN 4-like [Cannabis sativa]
MESLKATMTTPSVAQSQFRVPITPMSSLDSTPIRIETQTSDQQTLGGTSTPTLGSHFVVGGYQPQQSEHTDVQTDGTNCGVLMTNNVASDLPTVSLPTTGLPTVSLPTTGLPAVSPPKIGLPAVSLPTTGLPTVSLPTIGLPTISLPATSNLGVGITTFDPPTTSNLVLVTKLFTYKSN